MRSRSAAPLALLLVTGAAATAGAQPAWDDLPTGVWTVVSSNTMADVDPCPAGGCSYSAVEGQSGAIDDWCGGAFASRAGELGGLVTWGGGHNGYFGSEVYVFDLATGAWSRASEPYDNGGGSVAEDCDDDGVYPDGSACPTHTYDQIDYDPATNRLVILGGTPDPVCGGCVDDRIHLFDFGTGTWALGARKSTALYYGGTTAYDAARGAFWLLSGYAHTLSSWDPALDAWTEHGAPMPANNEIDGAGVVDPVRDLYLFIDARGSGVLYAMPLAGPYDEWIELDATGDTEIQSVSAMGLDWEPQSERFVAWGDGADVYVLNPPAGDFRTGEWVWARVPPDPSNVTVPARNQNGTYSRFRYAETVNAFLLVSRNDGPVWAYRLTPGSGTGPLPDPDADAGVGAPDAGDVPGVDGGAPGVDGGGPPGGDAGIPAGGDDDGCGCVAAGGGPDAPGWVGGLGFLLACALRRRP